ncbi:hypothetical protein LXL04_021277 [Taraxacum kok-saghyz]
MCKTYPVLALLPSTSQRRLPHHLRHPLQRRRPLTDARYVENHQQNIADAIDLLPRLTTGIDVNIKFTRYLDAARKPIFAKYLNEELRTIEVYL